MVDRGRDVSDGQTGSLLTSCPRVSETQGCPVAPRGLGHSHRMAGLPVMLGSQGRRDGRKACSCTFPEGDSQAATPQCGKFSNEEMHTHTRAKRQKTLVIDSDRESEHEIHTVLENAPLLLQTSESKTFHEN